MNIEKTYKNLISLAESFGVTCKFVPGCNGHLYMLKRHIAVGIDQPQEDQVVTLSHEIGHIIDNHYDPMPATEAEVYLFNPAQYPTTQECLRRERRAWRYARSTLKSIGGFLPVANRFFEIKKQSLRKYRELVQK